MRSYAEMRPVQTKQWQGQFAAVAELCSKFMSRFITTVPDHSATEARQRERAAGYESQVLRQAAYNASQNEMDWLLTAAIMTDSAKRRYCLERALAINPASEPAKRALAALCA